ncbi:MAG: ammonium transporter [Aquificaceae bacterium]|nr:ammonium transporter [Aquificaceae bacterium]MDW8236799.1 ammonium transporter [Aquificaceae bacterium]
MRLVIILSGFLPAFASELDKADTAWILVSNALVTLMVIPGLALFYAGLSRSKSAVNTLSMSIVGFAIASVAWLILGHSLAFGKDFLGFVGGLDKALLSSVSINSLQGTIPEYLFVSFQAAFAGVSLALISGALIERLKFSAWLVFSLLWVLLVYAPIAHWVWGGGFLAKDGALDFAGGAVVHLNAGVSALVGALILGARKESSILPHSLPLTAVGTGLLWVGWFGFNAGSALSSGAIASIALLNTNLGASAGLLGWMLPEWVIRKKPTLLGMMSGAVAGLVGITPAAGFVMPADAIIIGFISSAISFFFVTYLKHRLYVDDALDVFGIHGISGLIGAILTGIFATKSVNDSINVLPNQLFIQIKSCIAVAIYSAIMSALIFLLIKAIFGLRSKEEQALDISLHGESAYNIGGKT